MSSEPPEYHTKTLSPLSPLPIYPPEPSNIPVLRNQIDPVFNMTSTHIDPNSSEQLLSHLPDTTDQSGPQPDSPSSDSSFTDAYQVQNNLEVDKEETSGQGNGIIDDYAMTFDSDGDDQGQVQAVSQAITKTDSLPASAVFTASTVSSSDIPLDSFIDTTQNDQDLASNQFSSQLVHPTTTEPFLDTPLDFRSQNPPEKVQTPPPTYDDTSNGGVDIQQLLDNITANAEKNESTISAQPASVPSGTSSLPPHASLPPRPQVSQTRPYQDDRLSYPPTSLGLPPASSSYRPPGVTTSLVAAGAPGTSTDPRGGLPPPPSASYSPINRSGQDHFALPVDSRDEIDSLDKRWGPEIQKKYDTFLEEERKNVLEGAWDRFPYGSRLFVGNLASEMVTKRDLYHIFHQYGRIAQVSIKNQYGFIQYYDVAACNEALRNQEGADLRGKKIHLEVSKPQKSSHNQQRPAGNASGDSARGGQNDRGGRQGRNSNDRYDGRTAPTVRQDEYGRPLRSRDDYRQPSRRSLSPARGNVRARDSYAPARGRDSYGRDHRESRDRRERSPPYNGRQNTHYRERSPSPRHQERGQDSDLQIPPRDPRNVPDVQLIVVEQISGAFVSWVESEMNARGIKTEAMFLNPRISLDALIQRQVLEGVHAVSQLDLSSQNTSKISLRVFNRQAGANNVRFDEYQGLDPKIAAELVLREKQTQAQTLASQYAQPQFTQNQGYQPQPAVPMAQPAPNIANLVGNMDNATLQKLLSGLNAAQQQNGPSIAANSPIDLVGLLGTLNQQQQPQQAYQQPAPYNNYPANPPAPAYAAQPAPNQPQQSAQSVQNIMAALAKYR